jgi:hypothetical protein
MTRTPIGNTSTLARRTKPPNNFGTVASATSMQYSK